MLAFPFPFSLADEMERQVKGALRFNLRTQRNVWAKASTDRAMQLCAYSWTCPGSPPRGVFKAQPRAMHVCIMPFYPCPAWTAAAGDEKMGCREGCAFDLGRTLHP